MKSRNTHYFVACLIALVWFAKMHDAGAATERQVILLEAAENIKYVSQQITKAYFYNQQGLRLAEARKDIEEGMTTLNSDIKNLENGATDEEERNVLSFIAYTRDELQSVLAQPYSEENGALMIDFSDSLLEGAELIAGKHSNADDAKESMLITVNRMFFLLERVNKYYIAHKAGFKDYNNVKQLKIAINEFEKDLAKINKYHYPASLLTSLEKINKFWPIAKRFYIGIEKGSLPVIVMSSTDNLEKQLNKLTAYHIKETTAK